MKINKVEFCLADHLCLAQVNRADHTVRLGYYIPWYVLPLRHGSFAAVTQETHRKNGTVYYQTKLELKTQCEQELTLLPCVFRIHTIDGRQFILGTAERPYPVVNLKNSESGSPTEATRYQLTVSWESTLPLLLQV